MADLVIGGLHLGMVTIDVLSREAKELLVVGALKVVSAPTLDCSHDSSF